MIVDASQNAHDRYGRTLVHPDCNGNLSVLAAAAGAGRSHIFDSSHPPQRAREVAAAEDSAHGAGRGLWGPPCFGNTDAQPR
uniref:TNase-like domain-containing protein n=1 Tax=Mycobacterium sp. (strain KMS) TaxID=189918 RepID=A1UPL3_MYCSK